MSSLLYTIGHWAFRRRGTVLAGWIIVLALIGGAAGLFNKGTDDSFTIPGTESQIALDNLSATFPEVSGASAQLVVQAADGDSVTDADYRDAIEDAVEELDDQDQVSAATSPFDDMIDGMVSDDDRAAIISIQMDGALADITDASTEALTQAADDLRAALPSDAEVALGGELFNIEIPGVTVTEAIGVLIALVVLIITFGSFAAAGMPLLTAIIGVGISIALIFAATAFAPISQTTPLLALMLGLAVGIDYSLFIISRHQDLLRSGTPPEEAAARSVATAGSAVVFAGLTVVIALIGLSVAQIPFLTTMGIAAAVSVAVAVLIALTLTPALLSFGGTRLLGRGHRSGEAAEPKQNRFFLGWVRAVTARPLLTVIVVVGLGLTAIPASQLRLALPDATNLAEGSPARESAEIVSDNFGEGFNGPLIVTATIVGSTDPVTLMDDLGDEISRLDGVASVPLSTPNESADTGIIQVIPESGPKTEQTSALVAEIRGLKQHFLDEYNVSIAVTGFTAVGIDISTLLGEALLPFGLFVVGLSLILLMMVFRSIWVPIKATLGYLLSVVASFGAVAAVFELGIGADLLHVAQLGPVISFMPIILMGVLFGLAMDYEVFLVSRMREEYVHGRSARDAVLHGFTGSAKVVTAAAVIMFAVFAAFVPEGDSSIKPIALGLAVGIFVDAFIVRMTLVPAVLVLLGDRAWWLPRWLDRLLPSFDVEGEQIQREIELADWPEPVEGEPAPALIARDVVVGSDVRGGPLLSGFSARVAPGGVLAVAGEPRAVTAALLALSGRTAVDEGALKVDGLLSGPRSAAIRARTAYIRVGDPAELPDAIRAAAAEHPVALVIDGIDAVAEDPFGAPVAAALDAARLSAPPGRQLTVVTGSHHADTAAEILSPAAIITAAATSTPVHADSQEARA
ncbi:MMPL family transporter [Mycetocola reblochoni]|uniref:MMPL family transporter n=1 Tax=Mycetocola reblochoni TaxID=331618 RepID=A0A3L6ZM92_9MICO|nr:MMPL family transporter [Mycetocola reblochoni]RLP69007.1 MMPL family transporter [Mycetocola reblochoni]